MTQKQYGEAYTKYFERTVRFIFSKAAPKEVAREMAQKAWVKGWEKRDQLRDFELMLTWVNSIALNYWRREVKRKHMMESFSDGIEEPRVKAVEMDRSIDLGKMLSFLDPRDRLLLEQILAGHTYRELAPEYGVTQTSLRIRLLRVRRRIQERVSNKIIEN